ncbi:cytochrome b [Aquirhabdus sp.]|uniref:cytochrome b n=1 Tax=Aquirhabdus sp. TaxID=2824160 RepID=UPI00396C7F84
MSSSTSPSYTRVAVLLHWLVALLIVINFAVGLSMEHFEGTPTRDQILFYHASFGSLVFILVILRLSWRITHRPPALPASVARWQVIAADVMHGLLYVLMLAVPLTGYLHRVAGGHPVSFFGLGTLPLLVDKNMSLRLLMGSVHTTLVWVLAFLVLGHVAAALKHHFIDRDGVLGRMWR